MRLNQVTAAATDVAASVAFYELLGLRLIVREAHYARFEMDDGEATFSVHGAEEAARRHAPILYFECDVDSEYARLTAAGVSFDSAPETKPWLWREAHLRDPAGNHIALFQAGENRKHPPWRLGGAKRIFHIILTRGGEILLARRRDADWRALQDEFADYQSSLGPYTAEEAIEMLTIEWPEIASARADDVRAFAAGDASTLPL